MTGHLSHRRDGIHAHEHELLPVDARFIGRDSCIHYGFTRTRQGAVSRIRIVHSRASAPLTPKSRQACRSEDPIPRALMATSAIGNMGRPTRSETYEVRWRRFAPTARPTCLQS